MGYWKSKVLPKIKKVFETKNGTKKAAATEASKAFDDSKEEINKEFEEKKAELQPKTIEVYEAASAEVKSLVKEPKEAGLKKHSTDVHKFLEELVKIEFPGSKAVSEAASKFGAAFVPGPVFFIFEKVSTFIVTEEKAPEPEPAAAAGEEEATSTSAGTVTEKDVVVEEDKKEAEPPAEPAAAPAEAAAKEEQPAAAAEPPKP